MSASYPSPPGDNFSGKGDALAWENAVALTIVQALLGLTSEDLVGVSFEVVGSEIVIHFAVTQLTEEIEEDVEDIIGEVQGLLWPENVDVSSRIYVDVIRQEWVLLPHRMVYLTKSTDAYRARPGIPEADAVASEHPGRTMSGREPRY